MAELVRLPTSTSVPQDQDYVLISRNAAGALTITIQTGAPHHHAVRHETHAPDMAHAIHRARLEADRLGIPFVLVAEGADA
jgi:hypothetical protein